MLARRLLIALAVLMALTALTASLAPRETAPQQEDSATPAAPTAPAPEPVEETLDAGGEGQRVVARVGQNVIIVVRSEEPTRSRWATWASRRPSRTPPRASSCWPTIRAPIRSSCSRPTGRSACSRSASRNDEGRAANGPPLVRGVAVSCDYQLEPLQPPPEGVQVRASAEPDAWVMVNVRAPLLDFDVATTV